MKTYIVAAIAIAAFAAPALAQDLAAGENSFKKCLACHRVGADAKNLVGPLLNGLEGRKSGTIEGYNYTEANKNSGITWNEDTFKEYITDPLKTAADWRQRAEAKHLSIRDLIIDVTGRQSFIGTPTHVADLIDEFVQEDGADGVILVPHITPAGLDDFVDLVIPLLQERGAFRTEYETTTLREHMGLPAVGRYGTVAPSGQVASA